MVRTLGWVGILALTACGGGGKDGGGGTGTGTGDATGGTGTGGTGNGAPPVIAVVPETGLDFGLLSIGETAEQFVTVRNDGGSTLAVSQVEIVGDAFSFTEPEVDAAFNVSAGRLNYVDILYTPMGANDSGSLIIRSDDPNNPEVTVPLLASARVPDLEIDPAGDHSFGSVPIPCPGGHEFRLRNVGDDLLVIDAIEFVPGSGLLALDTSSLPATMPLQLSPGIDHLLRVKHGQGDEPQTDEATLTIRSNDPDGPVTLAFDVEFEWSAEGSESFPEPITPMVDIAFLIDTSCSMEGANIDDVRQGIPDFLAELSVLTDWQLVQVTKRGGCSNVGIITEDTPNAEQELIDHAFDGDNYQTHEALLELAEKTLSRAQPSDCLEGFLRPGAAVHILIASDEPEQSGRTGSYWVDQMRGYVPHDSMLTVSGILDTLGTCGFGDNGYRQAVNITDGALLDICQPWGDKMGIIADSVARVPPTYLLSGKPFVPSMVVDINGTPTTDYHYDAVHKVLLVLDPAWQTGDVVNVTYKEEGVCP